jgi:carbon monoxide dehydrogenase subunit G
VAVRLSTRFTVTAPPDRVAAYLSDPRHLLIANTNGPVIDRSDGPLTAGSWFILALDQLRARVEYTTVDPPHRLAANIELAGRGSGSVRTSQTFDLSALPDGIGTRVDISLDGDGGLIRWEPLMRVSQRLSWSVLRRQIERRASGSPSSDIGER